MMDMGMDDIWRELEGKESCIVTIARRPWVSIWNDLRLMFVCPTMNHAKALVVFDNAEESDIANKLNQERDLAGNYTMLPRNELTPAWMETNTQKEQLILVNNAEMIPEETIRCLCKNAKEKDSAIIFLSYLPRKVDRRKTRKPELTDLAGYGNGIMGTVSDMLILIWENQGDGNLRYHIQRIK